MVVRGVNGSGGKKRRRWGRRIRTTPNYREEGWPCWLKIKHYIILNILVQMTIMWDNVSFHWSAMFQNWFMNPSQMSLVGGGGIPRWIYYVRENISCGIGDVLCPDPNRSQVKCIWFWKLDFSPCLIVYLTISVLNKCLNTWNHLPELPCIVQWKCEMDQSVVCV